MGKLPYFQFYPGDWLRDAVAGCSMAAQGFWLRLLIIMHDSERYGFLEENNKPISIEKIVARVGCSGGVTEALQLWDELITAGVIRCDKRGIFYSKRMVEDDKKRAQGRARTRKHRTSVTLSKRSCNALVTPMSQGSSSSSSSSDLSCLSSSTISLPKGTEIHLNGVIETVPQDNPTSSVEVVRTEATLIKLGEKWISMTAKELDRLGEDFGRELVAQEIYEADLWIDDPTKKSKTREYRKPGANHYRFMRNWLPGKSLRNAANDKHLTFKQRDSRAVEDSARRLFLESLQLEEQQNGTIRNETSAISNGHLHGPGNLRSKGGGLPRAAQALRLPHGPKGS